MLEKLNLKINRAYLLKESFRQLWNYKTMVWAARFVEKMVLVGHPFPTQAHARFLPGCSGRHEQGLLKLFQTTSR